MIGEAKKCISRIFFLCNPSHPDPALPSANHTSLILKSYQTLLNKFQNIKNDIGWSGGLGPKMIGKAKKCTLRIFFLNNPSHLDPALPSANHTPPTLKSHQTLLNKFQYIKNDIGWSGFRTQSNQALQIVNFKKKILREGWVDCDQNYNPKRPQPFLKSGQE